uniref:Uncharacterized protein n=1 Tax=Glossina palpalis gambiensis TaxID=67801 RepID=A0A1B0AZY5_9MUSC
MFLIRVKFVITVFMLLLLTNSDQKAKNVVNWCLRNRAPSTTLSYNLNGKPFESPTLLNDLEADILLRAKRVRRSAFIFITSPYTLLVLCGLEWVSTLSTMLKAVFMCTHLLIPPLHPEACTMHGSARYTRLTFKIQAQAHRHCQLISLDYYIA